MMKLSEIVQKINEEPIENILGYYEASLRGRSKYWNKINIDGAEYLLFRNQQGNQQFVDLDSLAILSRFQFISRFNFKNDTLSLTHLSASFQHIPPEALFYYTDTAPISAHLVIAVYFGISAALEDRELPEESPLNSFLVNYPEIAKTIYQTRTGYLYLHTSEGVIDSLVEFDLNQFEKHSGKPFTLAVNRNKSDHELIIFGINTFFNRKLFLNADQNISLIMGYTSSLCQMSSPRASMALYVGSKSLLEGLAFTLRLVQEFKLISHYAINAHRTFYKIHLSGLDLEPFEILNWINALYARIREKIYGNDPMESELTKATFQGVVASDEFSKINGDMIELTIPNQFHFFVVLIDYLLESSGHDVKVKILE